MNEQQALYSEQSVLGSLLLNPGTFDLVADVIGENDFFSDIHRTIWRTISQMVAKREPVDIVTVEEKLKSIGREDIGIAYLGDIAHGTPTYKNIVGYAKAVVEKRVMRELSSAALQILDLAKDSEFDTAENKLDKAQALIMGLGESVSGSVEPVAVGSVLMDVVTAIEQRAERGGEISGLKTGISDFDKLTSGLQKGDLIIVAGRPSMGKTSFCMNVAEYVAVHEKKVSLVFSMEMATMQVTEKSIASLGRVSLKDIRSGQLSEQDYSGITYAMGSLQDAKLVIDDSANLSVAQMRSKARKIKRKYGALDLIVIDYLQLMSGSGKSRNEDLGEITRGIKLMARELDCPIMLLSQLSRKCEERTDKRPMMSDLRDSGAIEQDADLVLMMYRHEYYNPNFDACKGMAEAIIRKQRMGELGTAYLTFRGEYSQFRDADISSINQYVCSLDKPSNSQATSRGFM